MIMMRKMRNNLKRKWKWLMKMILMKKFAIVITMIIIIKRTRKISLKAWMMKAISIMKMKMMMFYIIKHSNIWQVKSLILIQIGHYSTLFWIKIRIKIKAMSLLKEGMINRRVFNMKINKWKHRIFKINK